MTVIGIDLGTTNSVVAWVGPRGVEVIPNAEGVSVSPSVVTLDQKGRPHVGAIGARMAGAMPERAFSATKRLTGRLFADPIVQAMVGRMPYAIVEGPGGIAAIEGPQDSDLQIASVPRGPGLLSTPAGIAVAVLLALSLAANAVMFLLLRR